MHKLWLLLSLLAAAPRAQADVATDYWTTGTGVWLFYVDNGTVYRAHCDDDRLIYNRSTCASVIDSADFPRFSEALRAHFARTMPELDQQVADLNARIDEIDVELLTLLNSVPDPVDPTLKDQIARKQEVVDQAAAELIPIEDQIARIEDALRTRENPDLRAQLIELQGEFADKKTSLDGLRVELAALRQRCIQANSGSFEPRRFQTLQSERDLRVRQLESRRTDLDRVMTSLVAVSQALTDLLQSGFTNAYLSGSGDHGVIRIVFNFFKDAFTATEPRDNVYNARRDPSGRAMIIDIPQPSTLERFYCKMNVTCSIWEPALKIAGPTLSGQISNTNVLEATPSSSSHPLLNQMRTGNVGGQWRIEIQNCAEQIASAQCFLQTKPRR